MYAHLDMDSFFCAVEVRKNPDLAGKPIAIGFPGGRGVISSASYPAREFGVRSAMPTGRALELCPQLILVPPSHGEYSAVSKEVRNLCRDFCPDLRVTSIDEMYFHLTPSRLRFRKFGGYLPAMSLLKKQIADLLHLPCSIGMAPHPLPAKMATREAKPNGIRYVQKDELEAWLRRQTLRSVPGIGPAGQEQMKMRGLESIGQLLDYAMPSPEHLSARQRGILGWKNTFQAIIAGREPGDLSGIHGHFAQHDFTEGGQGAKSYSHEITFSQNKPAEECLPIVQNLLEHVLERCRDDQFEGRTFTLKIRTPDFSTRQFSKTYPGPIGQSKDCLSFIRKVLDDEYTGKTVRLIGARIANQVTEKQLSLDWNAPTPGQPVMNTHQPKATQSVNQALDTLRHKFGHSVVQRGTAGLKDLRGTVDGKGNPLPELDRAPPGQD